MKWVFRKSLSGLSIGSQAEIMRRIARVISEKRLDYPANTDGLAISIQRDFYAHIVGGKISAEVQRAYGFMDKIVLERSHFYRNVSPASFLRLCRLDHSPKKGGWHVNTEMYTKNLGGECDPKVLHLSVLES